MMAENMGATMARLIFDSLITAAMVLTPIGAYALPKDKIAENKRPAIAPTTQVALPSFSPVFFQPNLSARKYLQNDPKLVYEWVNSKLAEVPGRPDKFSSTENRQTYERALIEKMNSIASIPIVGSCRAKYDGDKQSFEVATSLHGLKSKPIESLDPEALKLRQVQLGVYNIKKGTYTGSNAYGATTEISKTEQDVYSLVFPARAENEPTAIITRGGSTSVNIYRYNFYFMTLPVPMSADLAREQERNIGCLFVISLAAPYSFMFKEIISSPSRDLPFETIANRFAMYGRLDQYIVINNVSGEVYAKAERAQ